MATNNADEAQKGAVDIRRQYERKLTELQQTQSVSAYAEEFRRLMSYLGWKDNAALPLFYKGLKDDVKDVLIMTDRPNTLAEYITMAVRIDNRLDERRQEKTRNQGSRH